jgi:hypothetical protein
MLVVFAESKPTNKKKNKIIHLNFVLTTNQDEISKETNLFYRKCIVYIIIIVLLFFWCIIRNQEKKTKNLIIKLVSQISIEMFMMI